MRDAFQPSILDLPYLILDEPPAHQIRHKNYSSAKLRETIDWLPEVSLADGIQNTVDAQRAKPVDGYIEER